MTWPTANVSTTNLEAATGSISGSRANIYDSIVTLNRILQFSQTVYTESNVVTYTPNYHLGPVHCITANTGLTLNAPVNLPVGHSMTLIIRQATTTGGAYVASGYIAAGYFEEQGVAIAANDQYKFWAADYTLSSTAPSIDRLDILNDGTNYVAELRNNYS